MCLAEAAAAADYFVALILKLRMMELVHNLPAVTATGVLFELVVCRPGWKTEVTSEFRRHNERGDTRRADTIRMPIALIATR